MNHHHYLLIELLHHDHDHDVNEMNAFFSQNFHSKKACGGKVLSIKQNFELF